MRNHEVMHWLQAVMDRATNWAHIKLMWKHWVPPLGILQSSLEKIMKGHHDSVDDVLEPNSSNIISGYLLSEPFPVSSGHLLSTPVDSHQLLDTPVGVSSISLFLISRTHIM